MHDGRSKSCGRIEIKLRSRRSDGHSCDDLAMKFGRKDIEVRDGEGLRRDARRSMRSRTVDDSKIEYFSQKN